MNSPYHPDLEWKIALAVREMLAGRPLSHDKIVYLENKGCHFIRLMDLALGPEGQGLEHLREVFPSMVEDGRPWLAEMGGWEIPRAENWITSASAVEAPQAITKGGEEKQERRIRFRPIEEFASLPPREWLISGILPKESIALVFGVPGCGKTFLTMGWAMSIGAGLSWLGREVHQGPVAYIAGEGQFGIGARFNAWRHFHQWKGEVGVNLFPEPIILQDHTCFNETVTSFLEDFSQPPVLLVLDTLSRCSGGADENSNTEMAQLIAAADRLQQQFHCSVLIVHHSGKDADRGPRGASSLKGNTETVIEVARTDHGCRVICSKQKDAAPFESFSLKFQLVQYGSGQHDNSAVLINDASQAQPSLRTSEMVMLTALEKAEGPLSHTEWKEAGVDAGLSLSSAKRAIVSLCSLRRVQKVDQCYLIVSEEQEEGS